MHRGFKGLRLALAGALMASMSVTLFLLALGRRLCDALPLHLCSIAALCAAALALRPAAALLDFLWYLGMPGAALALLFPAPAHSRFQALMNVTYTLTHLLILVIPAMMIGQGMRPGKGKALRVFLVLQGIALVAAAANLFLGTDYLFLAAPPEGTPLKWFFACGYPVYLIVLETLMLLMCMGMERLEEVLFSGKK